MWSFANAVADTCVPQIVPNIELQTIDKRTVIVVTVTPEPNRPYYLKSKGKENGTFIRLAGTSRLAGPEKIKELEMEGARISWDELTCIGYDVTEKEINKLCKDIMKYREVAGLPKRKVTKTQLINWKLLKEREASLLASNAFVLLVSDYFPFSKTQCAVFKGKKRNVFWINVNLQVLFTNRLSLQRHLFCVISGWGRQLTDWSVKKLLTRRL